MADAGGGHFYYIERPEQITDLIASEVGELLEIVARDAAIEITAPDGMSIGTLSPYRFEQRGSRSVLLLGDLVAGQHLEAVIRIKFGYGPIGSGIGVLIGVTDKDGVLARGRLRARGHRLDLRRRHGQRRAGARSLRRSSGRRALRGSGPAGRGADEPRGRVRSRRSRPPRGFAPDPGATPAAIRNSEPLPRGSGPKRRSGRCRRPSRSGRRAIHRRTSRCGAADRRARRSGEEGPWRPLRRALSASLLC